MQSLLVSRRHFLALPLLPLRSAAAAQIQRPTYELGDWWLYDWELNGQRRRRRAEVVDIRTSDLTLRWAPKGQPGIDERRSLQLNAYDTDSQEIEQLQFPLLVDKEWKSKFRWKSGDGSTGSSRVNRVAAGEDNVQVPAGLFNCVRVDVEGWWYGDGGSDSNCILPTGPMQEKYWYSPAAKAIVKFVAESFQPICGKNQRKTYELRYELFRYEVR